MLTVSSQMRDRMARLKLGLAGKADCVPVSAQISHHAARLAEETSRDFYTDAEVFLACQLHAAELYELDAVPTHYDLYNIEAEALGAAMVWHDQQAPEADPDNRLLQSVGDWRKLKSISIGQTGRMPFVLEINSRLMDAGLAPKVRFCGPVTLAAKLLGLEKLLLACMAEPEEVHALLTFLTDEVVAPWIICQREACGCDAPASGADAYASPPILTIAMVREFCAAYFSRLADTVGDIRLAGLWGERCLSDPRELLDIKRASCGGALQALDPDVTALGPALFKEYADQHDLPIVMGMDAALIEQGPVSDIRSRAELFMDQAGRDGRFVLFLNDVPYDTPPQHVHAAVAVAHGHRY